MKDPAIEEIRKVRHEISEQFGHDLKALVKHYQELEEKYSDRFTFLGKPKPQKEQSKS